MRSIFRIFIKPVNALLPILVTPQFVIVNFVDSALRGMELIKNALSGMAGILKKIQLINYLVNQSIIQGNTLIPEKLIEYSFGNLLTSENIYASSSWGISLMSISLVTAALESLNAAALNLANIGFPVMLIFLNVKFRNAPAGICSR